MKTAIRSLRLTFHTVYETQQNTVNELAWNTELQADRLAVAGKDL